MYYVETEVRNSVGTRTMIYNFKRGVWQVKMTDACLTANEEEAESIRSLRAMVNHNTRILYIVPV
jgi:hypothetical protein